MKYTYSVIILCLGMLFSTRSVAQNWLWARGNTGAGVDGWPVVTDQSGNVFVAGLSWGTAPAVFDQVSVPFSVPPLGGLQCIIAKYDGYGNIIWVNGTKNGNTYLISIATDPDGNSFLFGSFNSQTMDVGTVTLTNTIYPYAQYFIVKYDPSGNVVWAKNAGSAQSGGALAGGIAYVLGTGGITTDASGNIYITANFFQPVITVGAFTLTNTDPSGNTDDILLAKYDPSGNVLWAESSGGSDYDEAYGITVTLAGDVYIAGVFGSNSITFGTSVITNTAANPLRTAFIARYDVAGTPVWASASGGNGGEYAVGLAADASDNVYMTGGFKDNSISFSGTAIANPTPGKSVLFLTKFDPANKVSWSKTIYCAGSSELTDTIIEKGNGAWGYSIAMSPCGIIWVSGAMSDSAVVIDGQVLHTPGVNSPTATDPVFIAGYSTSGAYAGSTALVSGGDDQNGIACDAAGNVYMCADYEEGVHFGIGTDTLPVASINNEYLYVAKYPYPSPGFENNQQSMQTTCLGISTELDAQPGYKHYLWNDGHTGNSETVSDSGKFWVCAFDDCTSSYTDTFIVANACDCAKALYLPNSFTPNGDGKNDFFYPRSGPGITKINSFRVYNRWGDLLFERDYMLPNDASNAWDGTYGGDKPHPDVYVWMVDAVCETGDIISRKGSVTIIR